MFLRRILYFILVFALGTPLFAWQDQNLHLLQEQVIEQEKEFLTQYEGAVQDLFECASHVDNAELLAKKMKFLIALLPDDKIVYIAGALYVAHVFVKAQDELLMCMEQLELMHSYWYEQLHRAQRSYFLSESYKEQLRLKIHDLEIVQNTVATKLGNYIHVLQQLQNVQSVQDIHILFQELHTSGLLKNIAHKEDVRGHDVVQIIELVTTDLLSLQTSIQDITKNMHVPSHFERHKTEYFVTAVGLSVAAVLSYKYRNELSGKIEQGTQAAQEFFNKRVKKPLYNIYKLVWLQETKDIPVPEFESIVLHPSHTEATSTPVFASWRWADAFGVPVPVAAVGVDDDELLNIARKASEVKTFVGNINHLQDSIKEMVPVINETKDKASLILEFIALLPAAGLAYLGYKGVEKTYNALFLQPLALQPFTRALRQIHDACIKNMHARTAESQADGYIWYYTGQLEKVLYALPQDKADQYKHDIAFLRSAQYSYEQKMQIAQRMLTLYTV